MKLTFDVDELLPKIGQAASVVNSKASLPILGDLLLKTNTNDDGAYYLTIMASDSETWLSVKAPLIECDEQKAICVAASDFHKAISNLKGKRVVMETYADKHIITCHYGNGHFSMAFENVDDFPRPNVLEDDSLTTKIMVGKRLMGALEKAGFATAQDELRPVMNGVHFDFFKEYMVAVASDGHKLAKYTDYTETSENETQVFGFTLPKKPATTLINILGSYDENIKVMFNDRVVIFDNHDFVLTTRLIEGRYPNYDAVIPKDNNIIAIVNKSDMIAALRRVLPMTNTSSELVSVKIGGHKLTLAAVDFDFSKSASEFIDCDYDGDEITIGFKGSTMLAVLSNIYCDQIKICLKEPSRAGLFAPATKPETSDYVSILMPMLIND